MKNTYTLTLTHTRLQGLPCYMAALLLALLIAQNGAAQNIGFGVANPLAKLHVGSGSIRIDENLLVYGEGTILNKLTIGNLVGDSNYKLRVVTGKTWTSTLTAGGEGFAGKMLSVYGDAQLSQNMQTGSLNVLQDGNVNGNFRIDGRMGINGPTNASYGLMVNNANSYLQGDAIVEGNARIDGRIGINGATNANYGLIVNNANSYLQGNLTVNNDAVVNGNARVDGRIGINGATNANYGLMVNNANTYLQGNATISGDLTVLGSTTINGNGSVRSNGSSSLKIGFSSVYINKNVGGNDDTYQTFNLPEFGASVDNVRVDIAQFMPSGGSDTADFIWWVSDVDPAANTARIRMRNITVGGKSLIGTFYITLIYKD